jgi:hypothetical protein
MIWVVIAIFGLCAIVGVAAVLMSGPSDDEEYLP